MGYAFDNNLKQKNKMALFGKTKSNDCTTELKAALGEQIVDNAKKYETGLMSLKNSDRPASDIHKDLEGAKSNALNLIKKYIEKCGAIEIQGRRYTDPADAFNAEREEVKRNGLSLPSPDSEEF